MAYDATKLFRRTTVGRRALSGPDLFLSYAREDEARARELATALDATRVLRVLGPRDPAGRTRGTATSANPSPRLDASWLRGPAIRSPRNGCSRRRARAGIARCSCRSFSKRCQPPFGFRSIQAANLTDWRPDRPSPAFDGLLRAQFRGSSRSKPARELALRLSSTSQPAPSEPETKARSSVTSLTPPPTRDRRAEPVTPPNRRARAWSRLTLLAIVVAFIGLAGAGGGIALVATTAGADK